MFPVVSLRRRLNIVVASVRNAAEVTGKRIPQFVRVAVFKYVVVVAMRSTAQVCWKRIPYCGRVVVLMLSSPL